MDLIGLYNRTYARLVAWHAKRETYLDFEGALIEAHSEAAAHVTKVALARNKRIHSMGMPIWADLALTLTPTTMAGARQEAAMVCGNCAGSGKFWLKNARSAETGVYTPAVCFGCGGKGRQTQSDRIRNRVYWDHFARISI